MTKSTSNNNNDAVARCEQCDAPLTQKNNEEEEYSDDENENDNDSSSSTTSSEDGEGNEQEESETNDDEKKQANEEGTFVGGGDGFVVDPHGDDMAYGLKRRRQLGQNKSALHKVYGRKKRTGHRFTCCELCNSWHPAKMKLSKRLETAKEANLTAHAITKGNNELL